MKSWTTTTGAQITELLHGRCNCYLVSGRGISLLVDTGRQKSWAKLEASLSSAGIGKGQRLLVVLTHTHFDHAENAAQLKSDYDVTMMVHETEAGFLEVGDSPLPAGSLPPTRMLMRLFGKWEQRRVHYAPVTPDVLVQRDLDLVPFGVDGFLLHTPGHSCGSLSVILGDEIALVGDTMFGVLPWTAYPPYAEDPERLLSSWQALLDTGCARFLPAHGTERSRAQVAKKVSSR